MPETEQQTLTRLRQQLAEVDAELHGLRVEVSLLGSDASPEKYARLLELAPVRSEFEKAVAALTIGRMRTE